MKLRELLTVGIVALLLPGVTFSQQVFDNQPDFLAAAGAVATEDFEDEPLVGTPGGGGVSFLDLDDFRATCTHDALKIFNAPYYGNHNTTPGGAQYLAADTDVGYVSADVTLEFFAPVTEFGLYLIDIEEGANITIGDDPFAYAIPPGWSGGEHYFGYISDTPFWFVTIDLGDTDSFSSMDDIAYTPEPATLALLTLAALGARRR